MMDFCHFSSSLWDSLFDRKKQELVHLLFPSASAAFCNPPIAPQAKLEPIKTLFKKENLYKSTECVLLKLFQQKSPVAVLADCLVIMRNADEDSATLLEKASTTGEREKGKDRKE